MNRLTYEHEGKRVEVALEANPVSFGRGEDASHRLPSKVASRLHAHVFLRDGRWCLEDLGSANGTLLNGKKISGITPLSAGDAVKIGDIELRFEGDAPKTPPEDTSKLARVLCQPEGAHAIEGLVRERLTIGRLASNLVVVDHKSVSGQHCEIVKQGARYLLRDVGSSNGTWFGNERISERELHNGDLFLLGKVVKVYFIDPAAPAVPAQARVQSSGKLPLAGSAPAIKAAVMPAQAVAAPRLPASMPTAHLPPPPPAPVNVGRSALVNVFLGLLIASALGAAGYFLAPMIAPAAAPPSNAAENKGLPPQADTALSFEGEIDNRGNPAGWTLSSESSKAATLELMSDGKSPGDGARSLRISRSGEVSVPALLILTHEQPGGLPPGASWKASILLRAEGPASVCVGAGTSTDGEILCAVTMASKQVSVVEWTTLSGRGVLAQPATPDTRLVLLVSGVFTRLWIDRLEVSAGPDSAKAPEPTTAGVFTLAHDAARPGSLSVKRGDKHELRISPRFVSTNDSDLAEPAFWSLQGVERDMIGLAAALPTLGSAEVVEVQPRSNTPAALTDAGLSLRAGLRRNVAGATLALDLALPLHAAANIQVADRLGNVLKFDRKSARGFAYGTLSEITLDPGVCLRFPRGAVAWFDLSSPGLLVVTVRASALSLRSEVVVDVYARSVAAARLFELALLEGDGFVKLERYSAALQRFVYVADIAPAEYASHAAAKTRIAAIATTRDELHKAATSAYGAAAAEKSPLKLETALMAVTRFVGGFEADPAYTDMAAKREQLRKWIAEAVPARPPAELERAIALARGYMEAAREAHKQGDELKALLFVENVLRNYADTPSFAEAKSLRDEIRRAMSNLAAIDAELKLIDAACDKGDWNDALARVRALFRKYPDTPRNRDIMQRLHRIEAHFKG